MRHRLQRVLAAEHAGIGAVGEGQQAMVARRPHLLGPPELVDAVGQLLGLIDQFGQAVVVVHQ
jgi:hypothetical protein